MHQRKKIRVLIVEDSPDDRELILLQLQRGGYNPVYHFADSPKELNNALDEHSWDLILCDYSLPDFDGLSALRIVKEKNPDIPFILISGTIGETLAVEAMKAGAHDYLMKDNLHRLIPAIEREINEAKIRKQHKEAEKERDKLLTVVQNSLNEVYLFDAETMKFSYLNDAALLNLGYSEEDTATMTPLDIFAGKVREEFRFLTQELLMGKRGKGTLFAQHIRKDNSIYPIELHIQLIEQADHRFFAAIGFDQTNREKDARRIKKQKKIAAEHALSSKFKSEFLANMSHELRTPLNSIILLSKLLSGNKQRNLTSDQLDYIQVIHDSGNDLLELINEVLNLSKIEAGEMEITLEKTTLDDICRSIKNTYKPLAKEQQLTFRITRGEKLPEYLITDRLRLMQILKNFLSNAFKFTEKGSVILSIKKSEVKKADKAGITNGENVLFEVKDTGIGISKKNHEVIFESFRQVDGSIQRNYGGTGLGLTISNKLAKILGGSITLDSEEGKGSTFTLYLPADSGDSIAKQNRNRKTAINKADRNNANARLPSRSEIEKLTGQEAGVLAADKQSQPDDEKLILIAVNDTESAKSIAEYAGENGCKTMIVGKGETVLPKAVKHNPAAVIVDAFLPEFSGWTVAKQLFNSTATSQIPVWITFPGKYISEKYLTRVQGHLQKPLTQNQIDFLIRRLQDTESVNTKKMLLVDDNKMHNTAVKEFTSHLIDQCFTANSSKDAFQILKSNKIDCIVLDLHLPDAGGFDVLKKIKATPNLADIPVIIYTGKSMTRKEEQQLLEYASAVIFKNVGSYKHLTDEIASLMAGKKNNATAQTGEKQPELQGKKILIAEDDQRSFFSLKSVLESHDMRVIGASDGREALEVMEKNRDIDAILMDIMMPVMDGFETIHKIRKKSDWETLPIFAITAKAMIGDREKCIETGATDYMRKPLNTEKLISLLRIWL